MSDAPERIWRNPDTGSCYDRPEYGDDEYIRADLHHPALEAETPAVRGKADAEVFARMVYDSMLKAARDANKAGKYPEWVERGNSNMQVEARAVTARIMAALEPAPVQGWRTAQEAAQFIRDEVLCKSSLEAAAARKRMVGATLRTKVPALTTRFRWQVVCEAIKELAAPQDGGQA